MKRVNNIYPKIFDMDNLVLADKKARAGKSKQYGVRLFDRNKEEKLLQLQQSLINKTFKTSAYKTFPVRDPKERLIFCLPYFPDRILHHAIMNQLEEMFVKNFTADTYSCIKGRGISGFDKNFKKALKDIPGTQYCLKIDVKKFYPSIDHRILKRQLRRKIKDVDTIDLLDGIINSAPGVPIGNYLSQFFANFYMSGFDHWIKEVLGVKYYFRYCDDMVILCGSKELLHSYRTSIATYMQDNLNLSLKSNYRVFPVSTGVDVCGIVYYHTHSRMRKTIKQGLARAINKRHVNPLSISGYMGWALQTDSKHLIKTLLNEAV